MVSLLHPAHHHHHHHHHLSLSLILSAPVERQDTGKVENQDTEKVENQDTEKVENQDTEKAERKDRKERKALHLTAPVLLRGKTKRVFSLNRIFKASAHVFRLVKVISVRKKMEDAVDFSTIKFVQLGLAKT